MRRPRWFSGDGHDRSPRARCEKRIPIPAHAVGAVKGPKAQNLKEMQAIPGVASVRLISDGPGHDADLLLSGTHEAVREIESKVFTLLEQPRRAEQTQRISIPSAAMGLVKGRGAQNLKDFQMMPGMMSASLFSNTADGGGELVLIGTLAACNQVAMRVQALLNKSVIGGRGTVHEQFHMEISHLSAVRFTPSGPGDVLADFGIHGSSGVLSVLRSASAVSLTSDGAALTDKRSNENVAQASAHVYLSLETGAMCSMLADFWDALPKLPPGTEAKVKARFGVILFRPRGPAAIGSYTPTEFATLTPHKDYKVQFSGNLRATQKQLEDQILQHGYELMERRCFSVVHLVDAMSGGYVVTFAEPDEGQSTDFRLSSDKQRELERISKSQTAAEILNLRVISPVNVKKALRRTSLLVHPDKNAFEGADAAMKLVNAASDALLDGKALNLGAPPHFQVGVAKRSLPQIIGFDSKKTRHCEASVVKESGCLGLRISATTQQSSDNGEIRDFLERAWEEGSIEAGGVMAARGSCNIDAVRFKQEGLFSNGKLEVSVQVVKQKHLEVGSQFVTFPELEIASIELDSLLSKLCGNPDPEDGMLNRAQCLFREFAEAATSLASDLHDGLSGVSL